MRYLEDFDWAGFVIMGVGLVLCACLLALPACDMDASVSRSQRGILICKSNHTPPRPDVSFDTEATTSMFRSHYGLDRGPYVTGQFVDIETGVTFFMDSRQPDPYTCRKR